MTVFCRGFVEKVVCLRVHESVVEEMKFGMRWPRVTAPLAQLQPCANTRVDWLGALEQRQNAKHSNQRDVVMNRRYE